MPPGLVITIFLLFTICKEIKFRFSFYEARIQLRYGIPLIFVSLAGLALIWLDRYLLKFYSNLSEVGLYSLGYQFGMILNIVIIEPFKLIFQPMSLEIRNDENARQYFCKMLTYLTFITILLSLGISLLSNDILRIISDKSYWEAYKVVPIICLSYIIFAAMQPIGMGPFFKRKTYYYSYTFGIGVVINIILNLIFIPKYGMIGAAFATVIAYFVMVLFTYVISMKLYYVSYEWGRIVKEIICGILIYLIGTRIQTGNVWINIFLKIVIVFLFPVLLIPMRFYQKLEKKKISEIWRIYSPVMLILNKWK